MAVQCGMAVWHGSVPWCTWCTRTGGVVPTKQVSTRFKSRVSGECHHFELDFEVVCLRFYSRVSNPYNCNYFSFIFQNAGIFDTIFSFFNSAFAFDLS